MVCLAYLAYLLHPFTTFCNTYPPVIKRGNGKSTIYRWCSRTSIYREFPSQPPLTKPGGQPQKMAHLVPGFPLCSRMHPRSKMWSFGPSLVSLALQRQRRVAPKQRPICAGALASKFRVRNHRAESTSQSSMRKWLRVAVFVLVISTWTAEIGELCLNSTSFEVGVKLCLVAGLIFFDVPA